MVKPSLGVNTVIDGFRIEECLHRGGMATLWRVSRASTIMPMLMKVPRLAEGADPAAIVGFEMEQMICRACPESTFQSLSLRAISACSPMS